MTAATTPLLSVRDLTVEAVAGDGWVRLIDSVSFDVHPHEVLGVVGESGSGKSMTMLAVMGLLPRSVRIAGGRIVLAGQDLAQLSFEEMRAVRGRRMAMIFQDSMTSLNPVLRVGKQIGESIALHQPALSAAEIGHRVVELLERVGISDAARRARQFPHEFSGGMRQRAMIAMAIANDPELLIADEPTTALDATIQAQVMGVLAEARARTGAAMVFITHDLGLVVENASRIAVMYGGRLVEDSSTDRIFNAPQHPYTVSLLASLPSVDEDKHFEGQSVADQASRRDGPQDTAVILTVENLHKTFKIRRSQGFGSDRLRAVDGISFELKQGETLGLVGESGCGKSTLGRVVLGLHEATEGTVLLKGRKVSGLKPRALRPFRRQMQVVFQDPYASLDPRMTVREIIGEPLRINGQYQPERVVELLDFVGLPLEAALRRPAEFSGGQRQRIAIARALALGPDLVVLDEAVSALDVSIQAQVVNLLKRLQNELGLAYLFISHDLSVIRRISDRVAVMYLGKIVEIGATEAVFRTPAHPYTRALLSAVPDPKRTHSERIVLKGELPDPLRPPSGCVFRSRCFMARDICAREEPALEVRTAPGQRSACHFADAVASARIEGDKLNAR